LVGAVLRDELQNHVQITARMVETLEFLPLQRRLSPVLKCLKGFTGQLPDAAARIANDECGGAGIKRA
jgi:hypothetical protein